MVASGAVKLRLRRGEREQRKEPGYVNGACVRKTKLFVSFQ